MTRIAPARVLALNPCDTVDGQYVLYWMQQSQRVATNHALEYAVDLANDLNRPLIVGFGLMDDYPEANLRHHVFLLEGLQETKQALEERGIAFVLRPGPPPQVALDLAQRACAVVCDRGYLRHQRAWRREVATSAKCRVVQVESDVIVPVEAASQKSEYAARTLRPRIQRLLAEHLVELEPATLKHPAQGLKLPVSLDLHNPESLARSLKLDMSVEPVTRFFRGGTGAAEKLFHTFLADRLKTYGKHRNQPQTNDVSHMSKYLHFGQISPTWLALEARKHTDAAGDDVATFIEELLVRRELSMNFTHFRDDYDRYDGLPGWARQTLAAHRQDPRTNLYSPAQLEAAETHDPYWNAAMKEMRHTGYMHNYMRMYWGKKILEWSPTPEEAFATALAINNKYFLDGRDANSFANIAWVFGQHDRPWGERPIFGKVRYMNARGLERKCDIQAYVAKVERLSGGLVKAW
ncbi:MAG: photolyase FAD-binding protein [Chthoniobacter sp.]|nr:photolyase FAD-binding protein [Chthoniobacter sp.]